MTSNADTAAAWISGIVVPLVTPLEDGDALDDAALTRILEHVIAGGVNGIFILGTTGEGPSLPYSTRRDLLGQTCQCVAGRVPVLACISDTSLSAAIDLSMLAHEAGADAVVAAPPYYFPPTQDELAGYFAQLAAEVPLPLMLYNMPGLTKVALEVETLRRLADIENIVGVKDSSGDLNYFEQVATLRRRRPDWSILLGPEHLLPQSLHLGGQGGVNGGANVLPELFVELFRAASTGDVQAAQAAQQRVEQFQSIYAVGDDVGRFAKATKCALSILGLCNESMAPPLAALSASARRHIESVLNSLGAVRVIAG